MVDEILEGYADWKCIACWNSADTLFAPDSVDQNELYAYLQAKL